MTGRRGTTPQRSPLIVGGEPRVEMMPPEVAQRERARSMRNLGFLALVVAILVVAGGYALAGTLNDIAQQELASAQARTTEILAEQQQYNSVTTVAALISAIEEAEVVARSSEVNWTYLASEMGRVIPPTVSLSSIEMTGRAPWENPLEDNGVLREPKVAVLTINATAPSLLELTSLMRALDSLEVVADVSLDSVTGSGTYEGTFTVNLSESALTVNVPTDGPTPEPSTSPTPDVDEEVAP